MNERVKGLIKELGDAIDEVVTGSPRIDSIMKSIRESGYEIYLILEANIAVEDRRTERQRAEQDEAETGNDFTADDRRFLKRLRIEC